MKDLTDYFASSSKKDDRKGLAETNIMSPEKVSKEADNNTTLVTEENTSVNCTVNKLKNTHSRKKKKRKRSDPIVKNITEIFSNSLSISINSSNTFSTTSEIVGKDVVNKKESVEKSPECNNGVGDLICKKNTSETNYVNKTVILSCEEENSKDCLIIKSEVSSSTVKCTTTCNEDGQTLKSALNAFDLMMESRNKSIGQNSPGKELSEDEVNFESNYDKKKLRARKNLLENWAERKGSLKRKRAEEDKDEIINHKLTKRAKRLKKLLKINDPVNISKESTNVILKKKKVRPLDSSSESSKDSVKVTECVSTDISTYSILDTIEENAQDGVNKNTLKSKDPRQSLLTFFGVFSNETKKIEQKNNTNKRNVSNKQSDTIKSNSLLRNCSQEEKEIDEKMSKNSSASEREKRRHKRKKYKNSSQKVCSEEYGGKIQSSNGQEVENKIIRKSSNSLTTRSSRSWKMRIKLSTDEETSQNDEDILKKNKENVSQEKKGEEVISSSPHEKSNDSKTKPESEENILYVSDDDFVEKTQEKRRSKRISLKPVKTPSDKIIVLEEEEDSLEEVKKQRVKVAPVFLKSTPKPKLAPEVIKARRQFLMSGIPSSLKKTLERQQSIEEREYDIFPSISHVQQKCDSPLWTLTKPELNLKTYLPLGTDQPALCSDLTTSDTPTNFHIEAESRKIENLKTLLGRIKADNPNYPVYKSFRLISEKSVKKISNQKHRKQPKQKKSKDSLNDSIETIVIDTEECDLIEYTMWTEKYKPTSTDDIIGNAASIKSMKKWLGAWLEYSQEIIKNRKQRRDSTSESEFDFTDCDSRDSTKLPRTTVILGGPCGSGKSTAVYAVCRELGYNVIELNASSKRTGKRLLQELQEATQSHQVRKNDKNLQNFLQAKKGAKEKKHSVESQKKKMCVLLIEDIDIVFEQDDGFISAVTQLVATSKRPIVMTTTDPGSVFAQRFISQYEYISFLRLSSQMLATWLQIVCLVEGLFVSRDDIGCLLEFNMGDVRKTLLELQFWVQTGGQLMTDDIPVKVEDKRRSTEEKLHEDEPPSAFLKDDNKKSEDCVFVHRNCIGSFEIFKHHKSYSIPYHFNLGLLWWNIPNFLNIPDFSLSRLNKIENKATETLKDTKHKKNTIDDKIKLHSVEKLFDSLALTDVMFRKVNFVDGSEPNVKNYSSEIRDSLELSECLNEYNGYSEFVHEVGHMLIDGYIQDYNSIEGKKSSINMALPDRRERRWRAKQHVCEDVFQEALSFSSYIERKSVALDYMSTLRNISRSEFRRASNNTKRGNRFRNYLRDLNVKCTDGTIKLACSIFRMNDE